MTGPDRGSGYPGQVRRKPDGWFVAVRIVRPAAWLVINVRTGNGDVVKIGDVRAAQIYEDWELL